MKIFAWILAFFVPLQPVILNAPSSRVEHQVRDDYQRMKATLETMPHDKLRPLEIQFVSSKKRSYVSRSSNEKDHKSTTKYFIYTENSRGVWVHELAHYFSYHSYDSQGPAEYICQVLGDYVNGVLPETRKKYYYYWPLNENSHLKTR